jgi:Na+/proline symporter
MTPFVNVTWRVVSPPLAVLAVEDRTTIFAVVAGFLITLLTVGVVFRRFSSNTSDYFRAGGKATWWLAGGSIFMSTFSAWTFTGAAGAAFQVGWSLPVMFVSNVITFAVNAAVTAPWFRQLRCVTGADLIRLRFGPGLEQFAAWLGMLTAPLYSGVQLYGLAIFTSTLLSLNVSATIVVLGFVVLFYAALSGAWAVLAADFLKMLLLMPISLLLAIVCLRHLGGFAGLLESIRQAGLSETFAAFKTPAELQKIDGIDPTWFTPVFFVAWYMNMLIIGNSLNNGFKYLNVKDGREARRAALLAGCLFGVGLLVWFIPPMTARLLIAGEVMAMPLVKPAEGAYAAIAIHLLPAGLVGLVLVGMCAATMSSLDVGLTSLAGNITENIYPAACRRLGVTALEGRARFCLGKFVNFLCAIAIIGAALFMAKFGRGGIFKILMDVMATIGAPLATPLLLGLFVRRVPTLAPYISISAGFVISLSIYLLPLLSDVQPWAFHRQVGAVVITAAGSFLLSRALLRQDAAAQEREAEFFALRDRPVNFAGEIGAATDQRQLRIVGLFGMTIGAGVMLLLIPLSSAGHAVKIVAIALTTFSIGALMLWRSRRR